MVALSYDSPPLAILVVDDEPAVLLIVEATLQEDGHTVGVASNGADAIRLFCQRPWDVVLTDRAMPVMDGDALAAAIKKISPRTPVVMVTGTPPSRRSCVVDTVVPKPFTRKKLVDAISEALAACAREGNVAADEYSAAA